VLILDPAGQPARPWLTVILDDHSRAVAGYAVYLEAPSALQTALALRHAIWRKTDPAWVVCGLPQMLFTDHADEIGVSKFDALRERVQVARGRCTMRPVRDVAGGPLDIPRRTRGTPHPRGGHDDPPA
jgi:transposase InsO family protein